MTAYACRREGGWVAGRHYIAQAFTRRELGCFPELDAQWIAGCPKRVRGLSECEHVGAELANPVPLDVGVDSSRGKGARCHLEVRHGVEHPVRELGYMRQFDPDSSNALGSALPKLLARVGRALPGPMGLSQLATQPPCAAGRRPL